MHLITAVWIGQSVREFRTVEYDGQEWILARLLEPPAEGGELRARLIPLAGLVLERDSARARQVLKTELPPALFEELVPKGIAESFGCIEIPRAKAPDLHGPNS